MSQAWTLDDGAHADGYIAASVAMDEWLHERDGFVRRELVRGVEDRTHFINLRWWRSVEDYLAITTRDDYQALLGGLAAHLNLDAYREHGYPREFLDVVVST